MDIRGGGRRCCCSWWQTCKLKIFGVGPIQLNGNARATFTNTHRRRIIPSTWCQASTLRSTTSQYCAIIWIMNMHAGDQSIYYICIIRSEGNTDYASLSHYYHFIFIVFGGFFLPISWSHGSRNGQTRLWRRKKEMRRRLNGIRMWRGNQFYSETMRWMRFEWNAVEAIRRIEANEMWKSYSIIESNSHVVNNYSVQQSSPSSSISLCVRTRARAQLQLKSSVLSVLSMRSIFATDTSEIVTNRTQVSSVDWMAKFAFDYYYLLFGVLCILITQKGEVMTAAAAAQLRP